MWYLTDYWYYKSEWVYLWWVSLSLVSESIFGEWGIAPIIIFKRVFERQCGETYSQVWVRWGWTRGWIYWDGRCNNSDTLLQGGPSRGKVIDCMQICVLLFYTAQLITLVLEVGSCWRMHGIVQTGPCALYSINPVTCICYYCVSMIMEYVKVCEASPIYLAGPTTVCLHLYSCIWM
jgi:hypothetical protein